MNCDQNPTQKSRRLMAVAVFVFIAIFVFGCVFFDTAEKKIERIYCEATPCTDSLCLRWNDSLNRCGTAEALFRELQLKDLEKEKQINDSLHNLLLTYIKKEDSLITQYALYTDRMKEQMKSMDVYSKILRKTEMLDSIFNRLRGEELIILEKKRKELVEQDKYKKLYK